MKFSAPTKNNEGRFVSEVMDDNDKRMMVRLDNVDYLTGNRFQVSVEHLETLFGLDQQVLSYAKDNKLTWFGRDNIQDATIEKAFQESAEEEYFEPEFAVTSSGKAAVKYFDHDNTEIKFTEETYSGSIFVQVAHVWFNKRNFGIGWKLLQVKRNQDTVESNEYPEDCLF